MFEHSGAVRPLLLLMSIIAQLCAAKKPSAFLAQRRPDGLPPLLAPPDEWVRQLMYDGVGASDARDSYLSQLMGLLSGLAFNCEPSKLSKEGVAHFTDMLLNGQAWGNYLSRHA